MRIVDLEEAVFRKDAKLIEAGAGLTRILTHMQENGFAIISAFRTAPDELRDAKLKKAYPNLPLIEARAKDNRKRHISLAKRVRTLGYGAIQMKGYWNETGDDGGTIQVEERALFIPFTKTGRITEDVAIDTFAKDEDILGFPDFIQAACWLGRKYQQEAIIIGDTRGVFLADLGQDVMVRIGKPEALNTNVLQAAYSRLYKGNKGNHRFAFTEGEFVFQGFVVPKNKFEANLLANSGLTLLGEDDER